MSANLIGFLACLTPIVVVGGWLVYVMWKCPSIGVPRCPQIPPVPTRPILVDREGVAYLPSRRVVLRAKP